MNPVVITGIGAVSCRGAGADRLWQAMAEGAAKPPEPLTDPHAAMPVRLLHRVADGELPAPESGRIGRASLLAIGAAREAIADAGLDLANEARPGIVTGTCVGDSGLLESWRCGGGVPGDETASPFAVTAALAGEFGVAAHTATPGNACAAGGFALTMAADLIADGDAEVVLCGGADAYSRVMLGAFNRMGALDPVRCRPFDQHRRGAVFGEGAGMLVLESAGHAAARGQRPLATLDGSGWSCDAHHSTAPEPSGTQITRAMREALAAAAVNQVGCVIPHGTGTERNDVVESQALVSVVGDQVPVYSLKALLGHTSGASAALAAVAAVLMLRHRRVPPNAPIGEQDPECKVKLPVDSTELGGPVLVNAYAFGGNNVSLVLGRAA
ncbi:beta-ketoacyl synthase [Amycolatopsis sp. YIM 10]|uniref:beta-ketoacyl-[acyl-carrier-protein] synthase family protein n=1 Tax=Amycolatopsis sp. YIM 10 TaxID=2653857 RepID=UPI00128FF86F|nr:beta-ketoacyl synthase N-terminal-like domain-containing protein [Amycolatopsis sp. YIM 10]QFU90547.1 3-oxoacyl-[acyl-carrier-protein] synthase 2 [Amycolatopsis sp. YIM 10]